MAPTFLGKSLSFPKIASLPKDWKAEASMASRLSSANWAYTGRPSQPFSWLDPRLIRNGHFRHCHARSLALYLVLVTVGNRHGISYYNDRSLCGMLKIDTFQLR